MSVALFALFSAPQESSFIAGFSTKSAKQDAKTESASETSASCACVADSCASGFIALRSAKLPAKTVWPAVVYWFTVKWNALYLEVASGKESLLRSGTMVNAA